MSNKYSLNSNTPEQTSKTSNSNQYQKVGIYDNVRVSDVVLGKSSLNKIPYIELQTVGANGEKGKSSKMWLSTEVKPDKTMSGWDMTARNLRELIMATHNITDAEARKIELIPNDLPDGTPDEVVHNLIINKVAGLLVGRPFRAKFKGEEAKPREGNEKGLIFATMDLVESMNVPMTNTKLKFSESKDIKYYVAPPTVSSTGDTDAPF